VIVVIVTKSFATVTAQDTITDYPTIVDVPSPALRAEVDEQDEHTTAALL